MSLNFIPILTWYENPLGTLYLISPAEQIAFPSLSSHFHSNAAEKKVSDDLWQEADNMPSWHN